MAFPAGFCRPLGKLACLRARSGSDCRVLWPHLVAIRDLQHSPARLLNHVRWGVGHDPLFIHGHPWVKLDIRESFLRAVGARKPFGSTTTTFPLDISPPRKPPLLDGRDVSFADTAKTPAVAVVNQEFARAFRGCIDHGAHRDPLGRRPCETRPTHRSGKSAPRTIVAGGLPCWTSLQAPGEQPRAEPTHRDCTVGVRRGCHPSMDRPSLNSFLRTDPASSSCCLT